MPVTLKLDRGFVEKLTKIGKITPEMSKGLSGEQLTLEIAEPHLVIQLHPGRPKLLELSDIGGSFALWVEMRHDKISKLKSIVEEL
jgi:hypothetical protein